MNLFSKYTWNTWFYKFNSYRQKAKQKSVYKNKKNESISSIKRLDNRPISNNVSEIRLFAIMRNESLRLPHFIEYYTKMGVDRFFVLDNNSTDSSVEIGASCYNMHLFHTSESYENHWYWMEYLLEKYGKQHWCLVVDIDELFSFPCAEILGVKQLCQFLEKTNRTAIRALLLDMYSGQSVRDVAYNPGQNPLEVIPYFDAEYYEVTFPYFDRYKWQYFSSTHFVGGMRERIFGKSKPITSLNKFPLFKFLPGTYLGQGMHAINGAAISDLQAVVFHTKFLGDCIQEAQEESVREQHFNKASYYKDFDKRFCATPNLCLAFSNSVRFQNSAQLIELNLMKTNKYFDEFLGMQMKVE